MALPAFANPDTWFQYRMYATRDTEIFSWGLRDTAAAAGVEHSRPPSVPEDRKQSLLFLPSLLQGSLHPSLPSQNNSIHVLSESSHGHSSPVEKDGTL